MIKQYIESIPFTMLHVCIDSFEHYAICGRAYCNTRLEALVFQDISDLIIKADEIFNENGNPLSFEEKRTFHRKAKKYSYHNKPQICCDYNELQGLQGELATLDIVVISRKKSSWQGIVAIADKEYEFLDVLELIRHITDTLQVNVQNK